MIGKIEENASARNLDVLEPSPAEVIALNHLHCRGSSWENFDSRRSLFSALGRDVSVRTITYLTDRGFLDSNYLVTCAGKEYLTKNSRMVDHLCGMYNPTPNSFNSTGK